MMGWLVSLTICLVVLTFVFETVFYREEQDF